MRNIVWVGALGVLGALASPAHAGDPKFEFGKADEVAKVKDVEWNASAEAGVVFTTGNSETTSISAGLKAARKTGRNKLAVEGSLTYARSSLLVMDDEDGNGMIDDEREIRTQTSVTAETIASKVRYDRFLSAFNSVYIAALASRDVPAGKDAVLSGQAGYSRQVYKSEKVEAVAELGVDYSQEDLVGGEGVSIFSARGFVGYKGELSAGATLEASSEVLTNLNRETLPTGKDGRIGRDTRIDNKIAASAKIGKNLAVQTSIQVKYDHRPGPLAVKNLAMGFVPEAATFDTTMKASLIYTFF